MLAVLFQVPGNAILGWEYPPPEEKDDWLVLFLWTWVLNDIEFQAWNMSNLYHHCYYLVLTLGNYILYLNANPRENDKRKNNIVVSKAWCNCYTNQNIFEALHTFTYFPTICVHSTTLFLTKHVNNADRLHNQDKCDESIFSSCA